MTTWIADTSILLEYLEVPNKFENSAAVRAEFDRKQKAKEIVLVPLICVLETGNHVGQNGNSRQRVGCAQEFSKLVRSALDGQAPFQPTEFPDEQQVRDWLDGAADGSQPSLVEWVRETDKKGKGSGLGDLAILCLAQRLRRRIRGEIRIWTLDEELERRFHAWK